MAQIAGGETDKRVFLFGAGQLMPTEPPASVHFELRLLRFEGLSPLTQHRRRSPLRPSVPTRDAGYDRCWHLSDMPTDTENVCSLG
jgi:hypothetical protein